MGNKIPKSYDEFEKAFQRKENNRTGKEQFLEILQNNGLVNGTEGQGINRFQKNEVLMAIFNEKFKLKDSKTGFHPKWTESLELGLDPKLVNLENSLRKNIFYVTFDPDYPPRKIIVGEENYDKLLKSKK